MTAWTCPTCKEAIASKFCATCGEQALDPRDLTWRGLVEMVFHAFSPVDGRILRSFRALVMQPGRLTAAFQEGLRKPYIGPFQIFLLANVLFFAVQTWSDMKIFSATLDYRLHQVWAELGQPLVEARLAATGRSFATYAPVFDQAVAVNAKSLIGLMVPPFAVLLPLVFWRRRPFAVHFVFALHFYAFLLLLLCIPLAIMAVSKMVGGSGVMSLPVDDAVSVILVLASAAHLYAAIGPAYEIRGLARAGQALAMTVAMALIFQAYRFILLPITLYTT